MAFTIQKLEIILSLVLSLANNRFSLNLKISFMKTILKKIYLVLLVSVLSVSGFSQSGDPIIVSLNHAQTMINGSTICTIVLGNNGSGVLGIGNTRFQFNWPNTVSLGAINLGTALNSSFDRL